MALVLYSDSEGSDLEEQPKPTVKAASKRAPSQTAAGFAVDKSNPRKIQFSLGGYNAAPPNRTDDGEPAPKRVRVGGGVLGGFNAMLPSPKRENEKKPTSNGASRKVYSLKTGAEPGFSRESDAELRQLFAEPRPTLHQDSSTTDASSSAEPESTKMGNPMRFRPLSVARNTSKKKSIVTVAANTVAAPERIVLDEPGLTATAIPAPKPQKFSLFSARIDPAAAPRTIMGDSEIDRDTGQPPDTAEAFNMPTHSDQTASAAPTTQEQSLDTIASDLKLSAADRRRLFGREGKGTSSAINIVNFNADQEYAANEALRASGEQVQHNPVRGIAPGKHSLKQLVNAASSQKEALEESFAAGKSNKREAGSRYGW